MNRFRHVTLQGRRLVASKRVPTREHLVEAGARSYSLSVGIRLAVGCLGRVVGCVETPRMSRLNRAAAACTHRRSG